jgi:hypothetical protein
MFFRASVHPVLLAVASTAHDMTVYTDGASDHPVLKTLRPKPYCLHLQDCRLNRCSTIGSSSAEAPVLVRLCLDSNEASDRPTVSQLRPSVHPVLLTSLLQLGYLLQLNIS